jgi:hypothetical protein
LLAANLYDCFFHKIPFITPAIIAKKSQHFKRKKKVAPGYPTGAT